MRGDAAHCQSIVGESLDLLVGRGGLQEKDGPSGLQVATSAHGGPTTLSADLDSGSRESGEV